MLVILQLGPSTSILNAADARPNDIHGLTVGGRDVRNSSNSLTLRWRVFSSDVEKLKWFSFDLALKLALTTKEKEAVTIQCVLTTKPSENGKCHWSVLEN